MLLYWGMFTIGFMFGAIFTFVTFAAKKPQEDADYDMNSLPKRTVSPTTFVLFNRSHSSREEQMPQLQVASAQQAVKES